MDKKDKEAFEKWFISCRDSLFATFLRENHPDVGIKWKREPTRIAWQAACQYKQTKNNRGILMSLHTLSPYELQSVETLVQKITKQKEEAVLSGLNDLVQKGLLVLESTGHGFVRLADSNQIEYRETVRLVLRDKEYIQKLEKENAELREVVQKIKGIL